MKCIVCKKILTNKRVDKGVCSWKCHHNCLGIDDKDYYEGYKDGYGGLPVRSFSLLYSEGYKEGLAKKVEKEKIKYPEDWKGIHDA